VPASRLHLHLLLPALLVLPALATEQQLAVALAALVRRHPNQIG
jgi:hypothetical protein